MTRQRTFTLKRTSYFVGSTLTASRQGARTSSTYTFARHTATKPTYLEIPAHRLEYLEAELHDFLIGRSRVQQKSFAKVVSHREDKLFRAAETGAAVVHDGQEHFLQGGRHTEGGGGVLIIRYQAWSWSSRVARWLVGRVSPSLSYTAAGAQACGRFVFVSIF